MIKIMKILDAGVILVLIGLVLFLGGIILNVSWLFVTGFFWLGCAVLTDNYIQNLEYITDIGDSEDEILFNYDKDEV